jgi:hypothetical protein
MPELGSRCMTTEYCVGVIKGDYFSIKESEKDFPETNPKITDLELVEIIIRKIKEKGIKKELGFDPYKG